MNLSTKDKRYLRAKYYKLLSPVFGGNFILPFSSVLAIASVAAIIFGYSLGWLALIFPIILIMLYEWYRENLCSIVPIPDSNEPVDLIDSDVLALITKPDPSNQELVEYLYNAKGAIFLANRFGLHPDILKTVQIDGNWWQKTLELYNQYPNKSGIDAAHIIVAMILTSSDKQTILSVTKNKEADITDALNWFLYVSGLIGSLKSRNQSGGIARDWATGYTPLLDNYATNISRSIQYGNISHREVFAHSSVVSQMVNIFTSNGRSNIALVGETGAGRSTCVQAFAEQLLFNTGTSKIQYNQVYKVDMASLLTKVQPGQLAFVIQNIAAEAYHAKNIVLYFDNAGAFFGSDSHNDITESILPIIAAGNVRMVFTFTPMHWQYLQAKKPQVVASLNYQVVQPSNEHDTLRILENQCLFTESQYKCLFSYESLKEVYRLADRYGPEIAMPGRAISILEDVARSNQNKLIQKIDVQKAVEQTTGIKISSADTEEKDILINLEDQIKARVIGQNAAVREIVSALKRSRAGVSNPNRPIGTFLFLGPTGVGKTEMAKTLAKVYFGGDSGMVRVDMNEYITQDSVHNLLSGNTEYGTSFLETVRRKPFSVILFDELEKAHPDVVNTLLQMLDEGVMRDADSRKVSFKDAIIIATSNAGADIIRDQITSGVKIEELEKTLTDDLIARGIFKPEFLNRFDGVIIFSPLSSSELAQVVKVMLQDININLANQGVQVNLTDDAIEWLVSRGYDERLGARPLRRMMQKTVESAVSNILLGSDIAHGSTITLSADILNDSLN